MLKTGFTAIATPKMTAAAAEAAATATAEADPGVPRRARDDQGAVPSKKKYRLFVNDQNRFPNLGR